MAFMVEYAKSGRSGCKGCGSKIEKDTVRLGEARDFGDEGARSGYTYRHLDCVNPTVLTNVKEKGGARNIGGFARLSIEDQHKVLAAFGQSIPASSPASSSLQLPPSPDPSQAMTATATTSQKRKRDDNHGSRAEIIELSDSDESEEEVVPAKKRKQASDAPAPPTAPPAIASSSTAGPSRPSALSALKALTARPVTTPTQEPEVVDLDAAENDEVYTVLHTDVVGTSYYTGLVGVGEQVVLLREPQNPYDRNAIRVLNISGLQVGHIPKNVACYLAPLIDRGQISVEGMMTSGNLTGNIGRYGKLRIDVSVIGPSDPIRRQAVELQLTAVMPRQQGYQAPPTTSYTAAQILSGSTSASALSRITPAEAEKAAQLASIMSNMAQLDDTSRRETLLNSLCGQDVLELPLHPDPPTVESGLLNADLLKHQKQALLWCINAENPKLPTTPDDKSCQFWKCVTANNKKYYYNMATKTPQEKVPTLGRGGILGDDMGLGKTLTVLSLILATRDEETSSGYSGATLLVAPLSVVSNWSTQIEEHITEDAGFNVHLYYGSGRNVSTKFLKSRDIVITTYQILTADCPSTQNVVAADGTTSLQVSASKSGLFAVKWKRCVLDEGHTIRNPKTKTAVACFAVDAERRWVVSGTPIINNPSDLGALLRFLRICSPLDKPEYFTRLLSRPLTKGNLNAVELLKALMSSCCLRRTKEMQDKEGKALVPLPPVVINVVRVQLDDATRELYDAVESESRDLVHTFYANGGHRDELPVGVNVLSMLTRLRQIALDRNLIPTNYLQDLRAAIKASHQQQAGVHHVHTQQVSPEEKERLQQLLEQAIKDDEECPVCFDPLTNPRITPCSHYFCLLCISEVINRQAQCPLDRRPLGIQTLIEPPPPPVVEEEVVKEDTPELDGVPSAKVVQLVELLKMQPWDSKSLVFSQFTTFLNRIAAALKDAQIPYVQFDGGMSAKKRKEVLDLFSVPLTKDKNAFADDTDDEEQTEPETDEEGYAEYWRKRKGKGKPMARPVQMPGGGKGRNPVVMLISLKSGALGINATVANNIFLMDPWWQEAIESQAIDRVNRLGQKKNVYVYQMIAEDTVEDKVLQIQERKKELIKQAFSGTKDAQTQREKKEARLHELIELFGK